MRINIPVEKLMAPENLILENFLDKKSLRKKDKYHFVCDFLFTLRFMTRRKPDSYIPIAANMMAKLLGSRDYPRIIEDLIKIGVIECNYDFSPGKRCMGYRFLKEYDTKFVGRAVKDKKLIIRAQKHFKERAASEEKTDKEQNGVAYFTRKNIKDIIISDKEVFEKIKHFQYEAFRDNKEETPRDIELQLLYRQEVLEDLRDGHIWVKKVGGRVYSTYSALTRDIRPFLSWSDGSPIYQCDFSSCQPCLIASLYNKESKEFKKYIDVVRNGFYKWINNNLEVPEDIDEPRWKKKLKQRVFTEFFYAENKNTLKSDISNLFMKEFPELFDIVWRVKKFGNANLPIKLQKIESDIVIKDVMEILIQKNIPAIPLHDCIVTKKEHIVFVREEMERAFFQKCGFNCAADATRVTDSQQDVESFYKDIFDIDEQI